MLRKTNISLLSFLTEELICQHISRDGSYKREIHNRLQNSHFCKSKEELSIIWSSHWILNYIQSVDYCFQPLCCRQPFNFYFAYCQSANCWTQLESNSTYCFVMAGSQAECLFLKICLVPGNFHANLSPKLKLHISVNDGFYPKITYPTLNLRINQLD